jgi:hypothetical protein
VYWDNQLSDSIGTAAEENSQISGSYGVPERIHALLVKKGYVK